jgi:hypothetical protein
MKHWQLAIGYGILGIAVFLSFAGFGLALANSHNKATKASVAALEAKANPGAQAAYKAACDATAQSAAGAGLVLTECKLTKLAKGQPNPQLQGDQAQVQLQVKETGGNYFIINVTLSKAAYQPKAVQVVAQPSKPVATLH